MAQRYFFSGSSPLAWPVQQGADGVHDGLHSRPDPSAHFPAQPVTLPATVTLTRACYDG